VHLDSSNTSTQHIGTSYFSTTGYINTVTFPGV